MKLCAHCAELLDVDIVKCTFCGHDPDIPSIVSQFSIDAVNYGYRYRIRYEKQVEKYGKVRGMYALPGANELFIFLAGAALSGIVGNISTDAFKALGRTILQRLVSAKPDKSFDEVLNILEDEEKLIEFYEYIQAYYHDMPFVNREVMIALRQERLANAVEAIMNGNPSLSPGEATRLAMRMPDSKNMHEKPSIDELKIILDCCRGLNNDRYA